LKLDSSINMPDKQLNATPSEETGSSGQTLPTFCFVALKSLKLDERASVNYPRVSWSTVADNPVSQNSALAAVGTDGEGGMKEDSSQEEQTADKPATVLVGTIDGRMSLSSLPAKSGSARPTIHFIADQTIVGDFAHSLGQSFQEAAVTDLQELSKCMALLSHASRRKGESTIGWFNPLGGCCTRFWEQKAQEYASSWDSIADGQNAATTSYSVEFKHPGASTLAPGTFPFTKMRIELENTGQDVEESE
jgi:hypothetical protein